MPLDHIFTFIQNRNRATHQSKDMHGKAKKSYFFEKTSSKRGSKFPEKTRFWRCFCFSDRSKKFSTRPMTMFKIYRKCLWILTLRSYKNRNRATHQSKNMHGKAKKVRVLWKSGKILLKKRVWKQKNLKTPFLRVILLFRSF